MLAKSNRIPKEDIAKTVKKKGSGDKFFTVKFSQNALGSARFSFVVSSKILKKATERNLLKRRAREIIRRNLENIKKGYDIVFIFSKEALELSYKELEEKILYACKKYL